MTNSTPLEPQVPTTQESVPAPPRFTGADAVNRYQRSGRFHPFTCGPCPTPVRDEFPLVAHEETTPEGETVVVLTCPRDCGWRQVLSAERVEGIELVMDAPTSMFPWLTNPDGDLETSTA